MLVAVPEGLRGGMIMQVPVAPGGRAVEAEIPEGLGPGDELQQIILQLNKLVDVIHAKDHSDSDALTRELALFKVGCSVVERSEVLQITEVFRGKTVDISEDTITIEATGTSDKMNALESLLGKFDLKEMIRTGKVVMARGNEMT